MANNYSIVNEPVTLGNSREYQNFDKKEERGTLYKASVEYNVNKELIEQDIAQSRYFTVLLKDNDNYIENDALNLKLPCESMDSVDYKFQTDRFLPVKSLSITDTSYDNLSIPMSTFSDIPLMNKKKTCNLQLTCYDIDDDRLERILRIWKNRCFIGNRVVYMSYIYKIFQYRSYNVQGKLNFSADYYVIPVGPLTISRDYESNNEKLITFNLATIGEAATNSSLYIGMEPNKY